MNLKYYDGSGNRYAIDEAKKITFKPITPNESSSGMYSGGSPWSRTLDDAEYAQLVTLFDSAFADPDGESNSRGRQMGSGLCEKSTNEGGQQSTTLPMNNATKRELEQYLKRLKTV